MPIQGIPGSGGSGGEGGLTSPLVENVMVASANTEQSHAFPGYTKSITVKARGPSRVQVSFEAGMSGSEFFTIWPGAVYTQEGITSPLTTIYFQSPVAGLVLELISWS